MSAMIMDGRMRTRIKKEIDLAEAKAWWVCPHCGNVFPKELIRGCYCTQDVNGSWVYTPVLQVPDEQLAAVQAAWALGGKAAVLALVPLLLALRWRKKNRRDHQR